MAQSNELEIDKLAKQWVQLAQQNNEIKQQWRLRKPVLQQQLQLLKAEKDRLTVLLNQDDDVSNDMQQERFTLLQQQTEFESTQDNLTAILDKTQQRLITLYPQLPPPLKIRWDTELALLQTFKDNSERLEKQLFLLDSLAGYNQRIAVHQANMTFDDGQEVHVKQIYLGTYLGWYVSQNGQYWGSGKSTSAGWQWQHQSKQITSQQLLDLIAATEDFSHAELIRLPINIMGSL
tara:strand:+ start:6558 stop:7259 length:702 start_codon:yes stop_codon:yes gene_type:complete